MVYEAIELRKKGMTAIEMYRELENLVKKVKLLAMVDTLEYLKKGGRLSSTAAFIGSVFNIKPVITAKEGLIAVVGKERGQKAAMKFIANKMLEEKPEPGHKMVFGHSDAPHLTGILKSVISEITDIQNSEEVELGPVVGVHAGPGCAGLAYISEKEQNN
jgi:DegV family protein with EDD domain